MSSLVKISRTKALVAAKNCIANIKANKKEFQLEIYEKYRRRWFGLLANRTDKEIEKKLDIVDKVTLESYYSMQLTTAEKILSACELSSSPTILLSINDLKAIESYLKGL